LGLGLGGLDNCPSIVFKRPFIQKPLEPFFVLALLVWEICQQFQNCAKYNRARTEIKLQSKFKFSRKMVEFFQNNKTLFARVLIIFNAFGILEKYSFSTS
jgi:hypothetical protein